MEGGEKERRASFIWGEERERKEREGEEREGGKRGRKEREKAGGGAGGQSGPDLVVVEGRAVHQPSALEEQPLAYRRDERAVFDLILQIRNFRVNRQGERCQILTPVVWLKWKGG
jgi:hypothetical protein